MKTNLSTMMEYEATYRQVHHVFPWGFEVFTGPVRDAGPDSLSSLFTQVEAGPCWVEAMHLREAKRFEAIDSDQWVGAGYHQPVIDGHE